MKSQKDISFNITMYQLMILLVNMARAIEHKEIGYQDANVTKKQFFQKYRRQKLTLRKEELERFLYACNLLNEQSEFYHPSKESFDKFIVDLLKGHDFNKMYNLIQEKCKE